MRIIRGTFYEILSSITEDISRLDFINIRVIRVAQLRGYTYM